MEIQDDRNPEQMKTHRFLVVGTDPFMSGWGGAAGGTSYAAWACTAETVDKVEARILARGDMKRVRVVTENSRRRYRSRGKGHLHIYLASEAA